MGNAASEKTESATSRRRGKERDEGHISKSQDLNSALMLTFGIGFLGVFAKRTMEKIEVMLVNTFTHLDPRTINTDDILTILMPFLRALGEIIFPFLVTLALAVIIFIRLQIGKVFCPSKIKFDLNNISPSKALKNARKMLNPFETQNLVEFIKSLLKLVIVFVCGYSALNSRMDEIYGLLGMDVEAAFIIVGSILSQMVINMCIAMLVIGIIDKKYQDYEYEKAIKMTKQEVKDEMKDTEGDPKIKGKIRSIQMKMARQRMFANIAKADVVVTNPTHYAIALEYKKFKDPAPKVVAKGVDFVAFKIREIAVSNNIPIVENPQLARTLYKLVPIDGIIPSDMFVAVAEVLAYVYNKNKGGR